MNKSLLTGMLVGILAASACPANADTSNGPIQMLPPTPLGSTVACPAGFQQVLSYSGTPAGGAQGGINCVPIQTDAAGDLSASGYIQPGNSSAACTSATMGAMRYNPATMAFEGCSLMPLAQGNSAQVNTTYAIGPWSGSQVNVYSGSVWNSVTVAFWNIDVSTCNRLGNAIGTGNTFPAAGLVWEGINNTDHRTLPPYGTDAPYSVSDVAAACSETSSKINVQVTYSLN